MNPRGKETLGTYLPAYEAALLRARATAEGRAFRRERLIDLIAEETDDEFASVEQTGRERLQAFIAWADDYARLHDRVHQQIIATDALTGQHVISDPLPHQLKVAAQAALDHALTPPGLSELGAWKLAEQNG